MQPKPLIVICEDNEGNATMLAERARELGADVRMLLDSDFGHGWSLSISDHHNSLEISDHHRNTSYDLRDMGVCFYLRSPHFFQNPRLAQPYSLLNEYLETFSYQAGTYLSSQKGHTISTSKPLNMLQLPQVATPHTWVGHQIPVDLCNSPDHIIKGLSSVRTQAVSLDDSRLTISPRTRQSTPLLIQERVRGRDIKTVFYRKRNGDFIFLPTTPTNHEKLVDYRFQKDFGLELCLEDIPWQSLGESLYKKVDSRFFDADFILTPEGELFFLEVNLGPSGIAEESQLIGNTGDFSRQMLADWLSLSCL